MHLRFLNLTLTGKNCLFYNWANKFACLRNSFNPVAIFNDKFYFILMKQKRWDGLRNKDEGLNGWEIVKVAKPIGMNISYRDFVLIFNILQKNTNHLNFRLL